jgi:pyruvate/2-oxoglutarate dehydrogenase complex dihydrolipoamide dehydrogenase (E3) component
MSSSSGRGTAPWDLLVVGGGTAGLVAAHTGAQLGARVALVEEHRTGGECLWTGCVPSKTLLAAADVVATLRGGRNYVTVGAVRVDFPAVMAHVRRAIEAIEPVDSPQALKAAGVEVLTGRASFDGPSSVVVAGARTGFGRAVLATGAAPAVPDVPGLAAARPMTSETVWDLRELPQRLLVIGGGPAGCELSQAFARLGSRVTLVHRGPWLLPRFDADAAALLAGALGRDGVAVRLSSRVLRVDGVPGEPGVALVADGAGETPVGYDAVLVATGKRARTAGLGLDLAGVQVDARGAVVVDGGLRTTNPRVWAAGDVTPAPRLTHLASYHAGIAATNALLGLRVRPDRTAVPQVVFTDPEVAAVGAATGPAAGSAARSTTGLATGRPPRTVTAGHDHVDRAVADGRTEGFTRLAVSATGRVTGATVVGPRAGESVAELALAVRRRVRVSALAATVHPYPTYGSGVWDAAVTEVRRRAGRLGVWRLTRWMIRLRRSTPPPDGRTRRSAAGPGARRPPRARG